MIPTITAPELFKAAEPVLTAIRAMDIPEDMRLSFLNAIKEVLLTAKTRWETSAELGIS